MLVVIVIAFVASCTAGVAAVSRGLPRTTALAAASTPSAVPPTPTPRQTLALNPPTATPAATPAPAAPAPTPTPSRAQYAAVTGGQLNSAPDQYNGKKVAITGRVFYIDPRGENTWVQVLTQDNVYVDVNFSGQAGVTKNQSVKVYGTADGKTTIKAADGNTYVQPYINPGDYIDKA